MTTIFILNSTSYGHFMNLLKVSACAHMLKKVSWQFPTPLMVRMSEIEHRSFRETGSTDHFMVARTPF